MLKLAVMPGQALEGEVVWDASPPNNPVTAKLTIWLQPLFRAGFQGESSSARTDIPGTFAIANLLADTYHVQPMLNADGLYVKEIT
ncbi:MAG TPA: hypothetical protein VHW09_22310 [Bryobacteraceae bacterium]|jgi:hypothetical protein|nr:hypothetical protein [Bryobacteraceae bacterium]